MLACRLARKSSLVAAPPVAYATRSKRSRMPSASSSSVSPRMTCASLAPVSPTMSRPYSSLALWRWLRSSQTWTSTRCGYSPASGSQRKNACASSLYGSFSLTTRCPVLSTKSIESPATENIPTSSGSRASAFSSGIGHIHALFMLRSCAPSGPAMRTRSPSFVTAAQPP